METEHAYKLGKSETLFTLYVMVNVLLWQFFEYQSVGVKESIPYTDFKYDEHNLTSV